MVMIHFDNHYHYCMIIHKARFHQDNFLARRNEVCRTILLTLALAPLKTLMTSHLQVTVLHENTSFFGRMTEILLDNHQTFHT